MNKNGHIGLIDARSRIIKTYKHSDNNIYPWPERIPAGWEFYIKLDFSGQVLRKIKK